MCEVDVFRPYCRSLNQALNRTWVVAILVFLLQGCQAPKENQVNAQKALNELLSGSIDTSEILLLVDKSDFTLSLLYQNRVIKTYPVVLGGNPVDDKRREGDLCTPEGEFGIRNLYPHPKWTYFIWLDYPNADSWNKFNASLAEGDIPSESTIGGEVGIHGVPEGADYLINRGENWTLGCVSLANNDIAEIYPYLSTESKIRIQK
jgi:murein L,D-transpeptidase YafK